MAGEKSGASARTAGHGRSARLSHTRSASSSELGAPAGSFPSPRSAMGCLAVRQSIHFSRLTCRIVPHFRGVSGYAALAGTMGVAVARRLAQPATQFTDGARNRAGNHQEGHYPCEHVRTSLHEEILPSRLLFSNSKDWARAPANFAICRPEAPAWICQARRCALGTACRFPLPGTS